MLYPKRWKENTNNNRLAISYICIWFFPIYLGIVAICMGVVLSRDYESTKHGSILIVMGIVGGIGGWLLAFLF